MASGVLEWCHWGQGVAAASSQQAPAGNVHKTSPVRIPGLRKRSSMFSKRMETIKISQYIGVFFPISMRSSLMECAFPALPVTPGDAARVGARRGAARRTTFQRSPLFIISIYFPHLFTEPTDVQRAPLSIVNLSGAATPSNLAPPLLIARSSHSRSAGVIKQEI